MPELQLRRVAPVGEGAPLELLLLLAVEPLLSALVVAATVSPATAAPAATTCTEVIAVFISPPGSVTSRRKKNVPGVIACQLTTGVVTPLSGWKSACT